MKADYRVAAVFDTETTNYGKGAETKAFVCLYIFNDIRYVDIKEYEPDSIKECISYLRTQAEALDYIDNLVLWGMENKVIPIICAYNLMFDMQTLMYSLNQKYRMEANAQSSSNVYTLDLYLEETQVLRFWDTYHLEMRGLSAMGETCGIAKASGSWDYDLIRTPETPLTENELYYAKRDVQVIPAYLRYILEANDFINPYDLGVRVLTKTSIVRMMARERIGNLKVRKENHKQLTMRKAFELTCEQQAPRTYYQYALRKACFRGGFTFTAGNFAQQVQYNVASLDVTSMHHTFINGRYVPIDFRPKPPTNLKHMADVVLNTSIDEVLTNYHKPFLFGFHARFEFINLRLKGIFREWGIALIPQHKFKAQPSMGVEYGLNERAIAAEQASRGAGWYDRAVHPLFAFGKLYSADVCTIHLNELELYSISLMYEWDSYRVILGEGTTKFKKPPDYVTLQSNILFETKTDAKTISKNYKDGVPYKLPIPDTIPKGIAEELKHGTCDSHFFNSYYNSTVKGMFNGIYGTMAQDVYKPDFEVETGELFINKDTIINKENWEELQPTHNRVFYNYGMRIVGGSRLHLILAIILLHEYFNKRVHVLGGDTDSLKISCHISVIDDELMDALEPIYNASTKAIDRTMQRLRKEFPKLKSDLQGIGGFEVEHCGSGTRYLKHMEAWNKARVSQADDGCHITCAGLSRPANSYHMEHWLNDLVQRYDFETVAPLALGYNVTISNDICHALQRTQPGVNDRFSGIVTDYLGNTLELDLPEAIALYPVSREIGDTTKRSNADNVRYLKNIGVQVNTAIKGIEYEGKALLKEIETDGIKIL